MKTSIVAQNRTIHLDESLDFQVYSSYISAKGVFEFLGGEFGRFNEGFISQR